MVVEWNMAYIHETKKKLFNVYKSTQTFIIKLSAIYLIPIFFILVSVMAFNEFTDIKKKLEVEEANRRTAEDVASEVCLKNLKTLKITF